MAEEFQTGICSQNWWDISSRTVLGVGSSCSATLDDDVSGSYGWPADVILDLKDSQKPLKQQPDFRSTLKMMEFEHSSSATAEWNQSMFSERAAESTDNSMLHDDMNSKLNYQQDTGMDSSQIVCAAGKDSTDSSGSCTEACDAFPVGTCSSTLLKNLITTGYQPPDSLLNNKTCMSYQSTANYATKPDELLSNPCPKLSPFLTASLHTLQPAGMHLSGNKPFWNTSAVGRASFLPSSQSHFLASNYIEKPRYPGFTTKTNSGIQDVKKNGTHEHSPALKRPRIETPSPLPTFKVRKEKLGDRITTLQQLVSPFGKTDTASVLHEAIEYIKLLHDQVNILSTPYMKGGAANIIQQDANQVNNSEELKKDLNSRGLCLVPIPSTFPVANETMADLLTQTYGRALRF